MGIIIPIFNPITEECDMCNESENKVFKVSNEVRSIAPIIDVNEGTVGVVTAIHCPNELYEVIFKGGKKRYVYPHEIELKMVKRNE